MKQLLAILTTLTLSLVSAVAQAQPDPQMQAALDEFASLKPKPIETLSAREARRQPTFAMGVLKLAAKQGKTPEAVGDIDNSCIHLSGRTLKTRIYTPRGEGPFPVVVYYHGGGWVIAGLMTYDTSCRALCNQAQAIIVSVHYRQGPEDKFPAAHEDAFDAYRWVLDHAAELHGDPSRVAVAGESAGGNLAANVAIMARQRGVAMPVHQALIYPVAAATFNTPSYRENAQAKPLNKPMMLWFSQNYLNSPAEGMDPRISLVRANVRGVAPATVITAEIDPLRSEGKAYADHLRAAGIPVAYRNFPGVTHEFFGAGAVIDRARFAQGLVGYNLRRAFANGRAPSERTAMR